MSELHDVYYGVLTDAPALAKELDKYMKHIEECLEEDCLPEVRLDLKAQFFAAKTVRENIRRVFDE